MRANIHVGLEAGECVRQAAVRRSWNPKLAVAFASLLLGAETVLLLLAKTSHGLRGFH